MISSVHVEFVVETLRGLIHRVADAIDVMIMAKIYI